MFLFHFDLDLPYRVNGILGSLSACFAAIVIVYQSASDAYHGEHGGLFSAGPLTAIDYFNLIGSIFFATQGHYLYPTIQHDMGRPEQFFETLTASNIGKHEMYKTAGVFSNLNMLKRIIVFQMNVP